MTGFLTIVLSSTASSKHLDEELAQSLIFAIDTLYERDNGLPETISISH